jgi:hypothetical protein
MISLSNGWTLKPDNKWTPDCSFGQWILYYKNSYAGRFDTQGEAWEYAESKSNQSS